MSLLVVFLRDLITIFILTVFTIATPINNGLIVKINHICPKEEVKAKSLDAPNKNHQELKLKVNNGIISQTIFPKAVNSETSCTNQVTKILFPSRAEFNDSELWINKNFINIPIIEEQVKDYTIIVAKAPKKFRIGRGHKAMPVIVYIVFPNDDPEDLSIKMPRIYFVAGTDRLFLDKNHKVDPVIMINSNRMTTGLKSNNVFKFVKFKNKLRNDFN